MGYERDLAAYFYCIVSIGESTLGGAALVRKIFGTLNLTLLLNWSRNDCHLLLGVIYHWRQYSKILQMQ